MPPPGKVTTPAQEDTGKLTHYTNKTITAVNWNIEWFGSSNFGKDLAAQENNAAKILKFLQADLYGICEVVDTSRFGNMIRTNFGQDYKYFITPYATVQQKLAFVYNKHIFRNATARPFMALSASAYKSFASGRFPYLFSAEVVVNNTRQKIAVVLMHAKANSDENSYSSRLQAAIELKDSLDGGFYNKNVLVMGDYNDNLNGSITPGKSSPYKNFLDDAAHYTVFTAPLNTYGFASTIAYQNSVIDQQLGNAMIAKYYLSNSAKIRTDVSQVVENYTSGNTSDHYPVSTQFYFKN